ncbi:high-affinity branched-chain amino acid ABC transporter permease LivM [Desulfoluna butyratoxydans]|uniref:Abc transporter permease n=1 Tax=Desulfoluna butyratoxydans TaxID=231438 RepID=A0A4U8YTA4_9BACT|nr:high-affinity branched-chain amino acid ABC transporter permease LivM [Desulfoluna butyratoxydans]VFQ46609.1 abc transporter permease [Desulfoluna butyratoxydans]
MFKLSEIKKSFVVALWFIFLTFPIMVIKVNTIENAITWRWRNMFMIGIGSFLVSLIWRYLQESQAAGKSPLSLLTGNRLAKRMAKAPLSDRPTKDGVIRESNPMIQRTFYGLLVVAALLFPFVNQYQTTILTTALMYVILGLGLNIAVGLAGLLHLGYVAFYAVGAYTYALLNMHFGIGFWAALPLGGILATVFGIALGIPVLRLRGDYLAIVTLGFGEMTRITLENWDALTHGPSGIAQIPKPGLFGMELTTQQGIMYVYYLAVGLAALTVFATYRLQNSRIGRALMAMREDEIASQAMGINITRTKLTAFALSAFFAGMAGVLFAAKTGFINPQSFTFMESAIILSIVVLGGMGSILGVIIGALILILLPEYLREVGNYRMLLFGASMVVMMIFRPQGIIANVRKIYKIDRGGRN